MTNIWKLPAGTVDFSDWDIAGPELTILGAADQQAGLTLTAPSPTRVTFALSPMVINLDWDPSVSAAPIGFMADIIAAALYLESRFVNAVTLNIDVGYGEVAGISLASRDLGDSLANMTTVSYAALTGGLAANATTATDASVLASLPEVSPIGGATYWVTTAQAKALGLAPANGSVVDGSVGFGDGLPFSFGDTAAVGVVLPGTYDLFATAAHEITELMGRQLLTGSAEAGVEDSYTLLDLLHFSAPGVRDLTAATPGYFSPDGGVTNLGAFNTVAEGDPGDWASSVSGDPFDAFASSGVVEAVSANDLTEMNAIGWSPAGAVSPSGAPTGVTVSAVTRSLASVQVKGGLKANASLANVAVTGGVAGDSYSYAIGGTGAAAFNLDNAGTLSVGASGAAGGFYGLTITADDQTSGTASPAEAVNVVVGDNGNDVIRLSSLPGIALPAPTFIYELGGIDRIDATGMTGTVYFDSGAGADSMTGGTGVNIYEYGGAADSTASAMDVITNFNVAVDLIDLTGMGVLFDFIGALVPGIASIGAGSIWWRVSGGDTFVYANTGNAVEALTSANMKIELVGTVALTAANFAHL